MVKAPKKPARARKAAADTVSAPAPPPAWVEPCQATIVERPPSGPKWRHEIKWDGYRVCVVVDGGAGTVLTRRGHDWTHRFKSIADAAAALPCGNAIIDGEAVVLDEQGRASFSALQAGFPRAKFSRAHPDVSARLLASCP
jgi:bifunctional non-homologous end joining protein LigD